MHTNIAIPGVLVTKLLVALREPSEGSAVVENVVYGFGRRHAYGQWANLRVERIETFRPEDYAVREAFAVQLRPEALARVVGIIAENGLVPIKMHRHVCFRGRALGGFSGTDDAADRALADLFGHEAFASILVADGSDGSYSMLARTVERNGRFGQVTPVEVRLPARVHAGIAPRELGTRRFARARLAFGGNIVNSLHSLRVGVVGCGGLGWRSASALADSGVGSLLLIDRDDVDEKNLLRLEGATDADVGKGKVAALRDYLTCRHPSLEVATMPVDVVEALDSTRHDREELLRALGSCDALLLVTDNHASRLSVMIEAERLGIPYVHCGMHSVTPSDMHARLSVHVPGSTPCAVCAGNIDRAEGSRRGRGYIEGVELPNVAAWNAIAAGCVANAVRMLAVPLPNEGLRDVHAWEIGLSRPTAAGRPMHRNPDCPSCGGQGPHSSHAPRGEALRETGDQRHAPGLPAT